MEPSSLTKPPSLPIPSSLSETLHSPLFSRSKPSNPQTLPFTLHYARNPHSHRKHFTFTPAKPSSSRNLHHRETFIIAKPSLSQNLYSRALSLHPHSLQNLTLAKPSLHTSPFLLPAIATSLKDASSQRFQSSSSQ
ncbi:hypothetical protein ACSQ67_024355 [Phaseolus vulgaris]